MSALATDFPGRKRSDVSSISVVQPYEPDECSENNMAPRTDDSAAIREATHGAMLAITAMAKTIESQAAQPKTNSNGRWTGWIQTGVICGMLLVSGTNVFKTSEATLDGRITAANNVAQDAKRDAADAAREAKKANINNAMLDTYNRELERALIRKGVALPSYPVLEK